MSRKRMFRPLVISEIRRIKQAAKRIDRVWDLYLTIVDPASGAHRRRQGHELPENDRYYVGVLLEELEAMKIIICDLESATVERYHELTGIGS